MLTKEALDDWSIRIGEALDVGDSAVLLSDLTKLGAAASVEVRSFFRAALLFNQANILAALRQTKIAVDEMAPLGLELRSDCSRGALFACRRSVDQGYATY